MRIGLAERTDLPAGNEKSSGEVFFLSVGKYVVRACAAKTRNIISAEKAGHSDKVRNADILHKQLASRLAKQERKILLRLVDLEDAVRNQSNLDSFVSGFCLASGIQRELSEQPPYSFDAEEERRACEIIERKEV